MSKRVSLYLEKFQEKGETLQWELVLRAGGTKRLVLSSGDAEYRIILLPGDVADLNSVMISRLYSLACDEETSDGQT